MQRLRRRGGRMTKQEHIEEIAKLIKSVKLYGDDNYERKISYDSALELAKYFYNAEYRKIPKDTVLLTKEECDHKVILDEDHFERALNYEREKVRKETAKEILSYLWKQRNVIGQLIVFEEDLIELAKQYGVEVEE